MKIKISVTKSLLMAGACITLAACQTTGTSQPSEEATRSSKINSALQRAANNAASQGERRQSSSYLEKIYKRNSDDPEAAANYASALRDAGYLDRAELVLAPFADDPNATGLLLSEYAAVQLETGNYEAAEKYAQKAVIADPANGRAYHYLGIALDAQGMHKEGERAFRKALDHWQGDPTSIMNNLALNLTSQGFLEEAIEILRKAKAVSPNKREIERNLRITTALLESKGGRAPKPATKPVVEVQIEEPVQEIVVEEPAEAKTDGKAPVTEVIIEDNAEEETDSQPITILGDDLNE